MDAKDKQMNELIMQVPAMKSSGRSEQVNNNDATPHGPRNPKRKAEESGASRGTGSGDGGEWIEIRTNGDWTPHAAFGFLIERGSPFIDREIKWGNSWLGHKKAYYNAREAFQEKKTRKRTQRQKESHQRPNRSRPSRSS